MIDEIKKIKRKVQIKRLKKKGVQISSDCRITGKILISSEPYLISIGKRVTIADKVVINTHDGGSWIFRENPKYKNLIRYGRVIIHDNCYIGHSSIIMPGVSIGPNSVVGAGSVVTKDVPPNVVVAGVPAKELSSTEDYLKRLLEKVPKYDKRFEDNRKSLLLELYPFPW